MNYKRLFSSQVYSHIQDHSSYIYTNVRLLINLLQHKESSHKSSEMVTMRFTKAFSETRHFHAIEFYLYELLFSVPERT